MLKLIKKIVIFVLVIAVIAGIVAGVIYLSKTLTLSEPDEGSKDNGYVIAAISGEGEKLYAGGTYSMPEAMTIVADAPKPGEYSPEGEITVTAAVNNAYINGIYDFTYYFIVGSDEYAAKWATGKDAGDYISVIPVSSDSAKVTLLAPFGAPIEIKAQLVGTDSTATCRVDYLHKLAEVYKFHFSELSDNYFDAYAENDGAAPLDFGNTGKLVTAAWFPHRNPSMVTSKAIISDCTLSLNSKFVESLKSYLNFDITVKELNVKASANSYKYRDFGDDGSYKIEGYEFEFETLEYSTFIEGFNRFSEQQKQAVYYAWHTAFTNLGYLNNIDMQLNTMQVTYLGIVINEYYDLPADYFVGCAAISGARYGENAVPDSEPNSNVTF